MHKKFEINRTKNKGSCKLGRKVVTNYSKSDLPLVRSVWSQDKGMPSSFTLKKEGVHWNKQTNNDSLISKISVLLSFDEFFLIQYKFQKIAELVKTTTVACWPLFVVSFWAVAGAGVESAGLAYGWSLTVFLTVVMPATCFSAVLLRGSSAYSWSPLFDNFFGDEWVNKWVLNFHIVGKIWKIKHNLEPSHHFEVGPLLVHFSPALKVMI